MKTTTVLLLTALIYQTVSSHRLSLRSSKIIGGRDAKVGEFPYQVSLQQGYNGTWYHACGGSIIDERHILTAGHCVDDIISPEELLVVAGELIATDLQDPARVAVEVEKIYLHEGYQLGDQIMNDIALLQVKENISFNSVIQPISRRSEDVVPPAMCSISGWGLIDAELHFPDTLQALDLPYVALDVCAANFSGFYWKVLPGMVCAGHLGGGPNPCSGDSGGGLVCEAQLTGIASWIPQCDQETGLTVFTDVAYYRDWIDKKIALSRSNSELK